MSYPNGANGRPLCQGLKRPAFPNSLSPVWSLVALISLPLAGLTLGCSEEGIVAPWHQEVTVYTALDEEFSRPLLQQFSEQTGIEVKIKADIESTKTVGLTEAILAEQKRPRCDLFWNNEVLHTLRLGEAGLLRPAHIAAGKQYPAKYRAADGRWYGFAARARVLLVNTLQLTEARYPRSIEALIDPQWRDRCGIAKPLTGTTATHAACLTSVWGFDKTHRFFQHVKANADILAGNREVARRVGSGALAFGLTDTDDAILELEAGSPVAIVYPDQQDEGLGTLFIPNTLALIQNSPHPEPAEKLLAYLLSAEVEAQLAQGPSAQIPLHPKSPAPTRVETPATVRAMEVDFHAAAAQWEATYEMLRAEFAND